MNAANQPLRQLGSAAAAIAILAVLAGRALSVYPLAALFRGSRWRMPASYQHALFWGGSAVRSLLRSRSPCRRRSRNAARSSSPPSSWSPSRSWFRG